MNSNDIFSQQESSTSDATLRAFDDDEYISERDQLDSSDILASLLETATVALNIDRRVTQKCIRRAAALLGIDLSRSEEAAAERSHLQGGLAPWQARRLRIYIEEKLDSTIRAGDLAGLVRLSTSYFFRAFRNTFGETPRCLHHEAAHAASSGAHVEVTSILIAGRLRVRHVRSGSFLTHVSSDRRNQSHGLAASITSASYIL